jgi:hypothetical protein
LSDGDFEEINRRFIKQTQISNSEIILWLREHTILTVGGKQCLLVSAGNMVSAINENAFRIYGNGIFIDVIKSEKGYKPNRFIQNSSRGNNIIQIVWGNFEFCDYSVAAQALGHPDSLDTLVQQANSYLGIWHEYNELEKKNLEDRARQFGWIRYIDYEPLRHLPNAFRLHIKKGAEILARIENFDEIELEISATLPKILEQDDSDAPGEEYWEGESQKSYAIDVIGINDSSNESWIDVRLSEIAYPFKKGYIYTALSGDAVRLKRRAYAWEQIRAAKNAIPMLRNLIEGEEFFISRESRTKKLPLEKIRRAFGGEPTPTQLRAIEIAYNTPDIAIIQGPPGTGKTKVISALSKLFADDLKDRDALPFGEILLTSFQHDAVDNVSDRSTTFGLPALRIGNRRAKSDISFFYNATDKWRKQKLASLPDNSIPSASRLAQEIFIKSISYRINPVSLVEAANFLFEISIQVIAYLPTELASKLDELIGKLRSQNDIARFNQEVGNANIIKCARNLSVIPEAFEDGGAEKAHALLSRAKDTDVLREDEKILIQRASDWRPGEELDFLSDLSALQSSLLGRLTVSVPIVQANVPNEDVLAILTEICNELDEVARRDTNQVDLVLERFKLDLANDPRGVYDAVWHYTTVLAATCQQAVGQSMQRAKYVEPGGHDIMGFDTVIVDEAARSNPLDMLIPMSLAKQRIILVGDHRQLPHMLESEVEKKLQRAEEQTRDTLGKSLFRKLFDDLRERGRKGAFTRVITLDQQYRMHPELAKFVSRNFYEKHDSSEAFGSESVMNLDFSHNIETYNGKIAAWLDVPAAKGREKGGLSKRRDPESDVIAQEVDTILRLDAQLSVGIITFYSAQVQSLLQALAKYDLAESGESGLQISERLNINGIERD